MKILWRRTPQFLAITICTLPFSPLASADSLSFYGLSHVSLDYNDTGRSSETVFASNSSRIGVSGEFSISDEATFFFQYEPGMDLTGRGENDGNGPGRFDTLFTEERDWFVGIRNSRAGFRIGRLGVLNHWLYDFDPFADLVGDLGNLWGATGIPGRADRAGLLEYTLTESITAELMWVPENQEQSEIHVAKIRFNVGDLTLNVTGFQQDVFRAPADHAMLAVTGDLSLESGLLGFGLQLEADIFGQPGNDRHSFNAGYTRQIGPGVGKLLVTHSESEFGQFDGTQWSVGYDYQVTRQVMIYAAASHVNNDAAAQFPANGYGHGLAITPDPGRDPYSLSIGLIYQFSLGGERS